MYLLGPPGLTGPRPNLVWSVGSFLLTRSDMVRLFKLVRVFWAMLTRTPYVNWIAARRSREEALRYRARRIYVGCGLLCDILGIRIRKVGTLPDRSGMLVVSNHFGVLDPLVILSVVASAPVGKAEMMTWPFVGWVSMAHGLIPVERERRSTIAQFTRVVGERLDAGVDVVVFPEGTTSGAFPVRPFKTGAFEAVAGRKDGAVLPLYLSIDSIEGMPAEGNVRRQVVWAEGDQTFVEHAMRIASLRDMEYTVRIGRPICTAGRDRKELAQLARQAVEGLRQRPETIDV